MSKKIKYIISISVVILIMTIGIITLILGLVPVGSNDAINLPNTVYIYTDLLNDEKIPLYRRDGNESDTEKINKIFDLLNDGFSQKALSAIFKGEFGAGLELEQRDGRIDKHKDTEDKITLLFIYDQEQTAKNEETGRTYKYNYLCFTVVNSTEWQEIVFGLNTSNQTEEGEIGSTFFSYSNCFKGKMKTSGLYEYVYSLLEGHIRK